MLKHIKRERGAALVTVMLFVVLIFILITAMLAVSGNEVVIAGLQRDSVQAVDSAQAGLQEGIRRVMAGRPFDVPFTSAVPCPPSGNPCANVTVTHVFNGTNSGYLQIDSTATVGRATRHLTALVLQQIIAFPPNVTFAASVASQGAANIACGDVYSQSFIQYKSYPAPGPGCTMPPSVTYAGYRVSKIAPGPIAPCYTNATCVAANPGNADVARWWPATRVTTPANSSDGVTILNFKAATDVTKPTCGGAGAQWAGKIPAGAWLQNETTGGGLNIFGYDTDSGGAPQSQLVPSYFPCGLPYEWISVMITDESGAPLSVSSTCDTTRGQPATGSCRWFKTIVFDEWFQNYWRFDQIQLNEVKRGNGSGTQPCITGDPICLPGSVQPDLIAYPQFGAVPPFPDTSSILANYDCKLYSPTGGTLNTVPFSCLRPDGTTNPNGDLGTSTTPKITVIACDSGGSWTINGNLTGYGTLVVNCNAVVNGTVTFNGTIIVNGQLQAGTGNVTVNGGLVAVSTLQLIGNITVNGGGTITNVPTGSSLVFGKAWWER